MEHLYSKAELPNPSSLVARNEREQQGNVHMCSPCTYAQMGMCMMPILVCMCMHKCAMRPMVHALAPACICKWTPHPRYAGGSVSISVHAQMGLLVPTRQCYCEWGGALQLFLGPGANRPQPNIGHGL